MKYMTVLLLIGLILSHVVGMEWILRVQSSRHRDKQTEDASAWIRFEDVSNFTLRHDEVEDALRLQTRDGITFGPELAALVQLRRLYRLTRQPVEVQS